MGRRTMNISLLSLTNEQEYVVRNILQSLDNAKVFCSYIDKNGLRKELEDMIDRFIKQTEKKINENF
jgi:hypothetical protein